jgi:hypothetical protein
MVPRESGTTALPVGAPGGGMEVQRRSWEPRRGEEAGHERDAGRERWSWSQVADPGSAAPVLWHLSGKAAPGQHRHATARDSLPSDRLPFDPEFGQPVN